MLLSVFLLSLPFGFAQETDSEDDIAELNPFVVESTTDMGYMDTMSLAGTRINSDLRDVATTVQVVTREFLEDTGANNINELFNYTTNTESGGVLGNFTGADASGGNGINDAGTRASPQSNLRVRGLGAPDLTRNFFLTDIRNDSYNTQRIEVNRGANAILFGLGSPAGVVNNGLITPIHGENKGRVRVRLGQYGSYRGEIDYNFSAMEDRVALRVAGLYDQQEYHQRPAYENDKRIYIAGSWKIDERMTLRMNAERGDIEANRPSVVGPTDWLSGWFLSGKPIHDLRYQGTAGIHPGVNPRIRNLDGSGWAGVPDNVVMDLGMGTVVNSADAIQQPTINSPGFFAFGTLSVFNSVNSATPDFGLANMQQNHWPRHGASNLLHPLHADIRNMIGIPDHNYQDYRIRDVQGFRNMYGASSTGTEEQGLLTRELFDWTNNLIGGNTGDQNEEFTTFNVTIDRLFLDDRNLGIELAYDTQRYTNNAFSPFQDRFGGVTMDVNPVLPYTAAGMLQPNPNFLRPYAYTRYNRRQIRDLGRDTLRATAFYELNIEEKVDNPWLNWLGRHVLTGLYNNQTITNDFQRLELHHTHPFFARFAGQPLATGFNTLMNHRIYLGPQISSGASSFQDVTVNRIQSANLWDLDTLYSTVAWNGGIQPGTENTRANGNTPPGAAEIMRIAGPDGFGNLQRFDEKQGAYLINATKSKEVIESFSFNLQSFLFDGHIVGTYGWRQDEVELKRTTENDFDRNAATNELIFDSFNVDDLDPSTIKVDTGMWSVVGHFPEIWFELPFDSDLSVHYGESENFRPEAGRINHLGETLPDPGGDTIEYGFTLSMFERKFYARFNWFETNLTNVSRGYNTGQFINLWSQRPDAYVDGYNQGVGDPDPVIAAGADLMLVAANAIVDSIPDATRELYNIRFTEDADGNLTGVQRDNVSVTDTEDRSAEGFEIELAYNPTPSWRIALNVANQKTSAANVNPNARIMAEQIQATLDTVVPGNWDGITIGEMPNWFFYGWDPTREGGLRFQDPDSDNPPQTMSEWNEPAMQGLRTSLAAEGTQSRHQRPWRVNFVTNFRFSDGLLKSLELGGAVRWESEAIVNYPLIPNADGNLVGDIDNPYEAPATDNYDFWARYQIPLLQERGVRWQVQLNVRNAFTSADDFIPISFHQAGALEGMVSRARYAPQRTIYLTNTFNF